MWRSRFGKYLNLLNITLSYLLSLLLKRAIHRGYPVSVSIEPTNRCNLQCPECPTGQQGLSRPAGSIDLERFNYFLEEAGRKSIYLILYFQGEPYLNKEFTEMISNARAKGIYTWTSTNGHYLTEENIRKTIESGLSKLIISLDGTDQESYEKYRVGGSYETVVNSIRDFVRKRKEAGSRYPNLEIQFLVLKSNQHLVKEIKKLGDSLGVDRTVLKTAQFYDFEQGKALMPDEGRWSRYRRTSGQADKRTGGQEGHQSPVTSHQGTRAPTHRYTIKNPLHNRCFRMWSSSVITWDGKVVPCCFDKDADHCMGDLNEQSFEEIWRGERYREFRKKILRNRKSIDICRNCTQRW